MNITPERALGLADYLSDDMNGDLLPGGSKAAEIATILRHYAEILPKWQAVLNAKSVAVVSWHSHRRLVWLVSNDSVASGTQLIIKPAP